MPTFNVTIYNCTGKPLSLTLSTRASSSSQQNPAKTINNIQPYTPNTNYTGISEEVTYPYTSFIVNNTDSIGRSDYYKLTGTKTAPSTPQWNYTLIIGLSPDILIDAYGNDITSITQSIISGDSCTVSICGYIYMNYYTVILTNILMMFSNAKAAIKTIFIILMVFLVVVILGTVIVVAVMRYKKSKA